MKTIGVIPARYDSARLPGKSLADINGKPMIWWTWSNAVRAKNIDSIYVATDSELILNACKHYGIDAILTSTEHLTGTDRIVEVSQRIDADLYVAILGDEPIIETVDIENLVEFAKTDVDNADAYVLCYPFNSSTDVVNPTTQKYALNNKCEVIFMSRHPIPFPQARVDYDIYKHVGVYAYRKPTLEFYSKTPIGRIESIESSEMLRLIENRKLVKALVTENFSMSVDTPKDLDRVRQIISQRINSID